MLSIIPDIDLLFQRLPHRGPTHSIIVMGLFFVPLFVLEGRKTFPYLLALIQHILIGDFLTGEGIMVFWPLNSNFYGLGMTLESFSNILIESLSSMLAVTLIILTKDMNSLLNPKETNLLLIIPLATLIPSMVGALPTPKILLVFHYVFFIIFVSGILSLLKLQVREVS